MSIVPIAAVPPIDPPTLIAPAPESRIKLDEVPPDPSSLIVEVKVISPSSVPVLLAVTSISTLAVSIAGPVTVTSLLAPLVVVMLPPNLTAVSPVKATDLTPEMVPPITIVPEPSPSDNETVSVALVAEIFPATVISPPLVSTENVPFVTTLPKKLTGPFSTSKIPVPAF